MAKSDDTEETKVTGVEDIQNALEGTLDASGEDQDDETKDTGSEDDDDSSDDSEEDDSSDDSSDDSDDSSEEDDDSEDDDDEDEDDSSSERRFSQFKGDGTDKDYLKKLEDGYANSSQEGQRLNQELDTTKRRLAAIERVTAADPKLAEALQKAMGGDQQGGSEDKDKSNRDPFLRNSEREWREKSNEEAQKFAEANPEVLTDPKIKADVKRLMANFSQMELDQNDRLMTAGEAMAKAYEYLGLDNKMKSKTDVAAQAKKDAAPARPQPSKKKSKSSAKEFTDQQIKFADKMGVSKETLSKYNK